jgi:hypothetical protein
MNLRMNRKAYALASCMTAGLLPAGCSSDNAAEDLGENSAPSTVSNSLLGCYTDSSARALPTVLAWSGATPESCIASAKAHNLAYAGVQYGGQCFGGNTLGYSHVATSDCNMPCSANPGELCGGPWRNGVYSTSSFVGCYTDSSTRALPTVLAWSGATPESCIASAKAHNLAYAGVQYGGQCFGGNTLGYSHVATSDCNMPCSANPGELCGGPWRNRVYSTGSGGSTGGGYSYSTNFPLTENPISEGGKWLTGKRDGIDWNDFRTTNGRAIGYVTRGRAVC